MKHGRYGWSYLFLSWGLGIVFLWIGLNQFQRPENWIGFLPPELPLGLTAERALQLNAILDTALGIGLILSWWPKLMALIAVGHLLGILLVNGIDAVLIRDVGLLGAALSLLVWPHSRRSKLLKLFRRRTKPEYEEA